jgi:anti-sigma B factor antagonist
LWATDSGVQSPQTGMPLLADRTTPDGLRIIEARGELSLTELPSIRSALRRAFADGTPAVILDMSAVTFVDSSALATLISESLDADKRGTPIAIVARPGGILRSLELKGLTTVLHIAETVDQAIELVRPRA